MLHSRYLRTRKRDGWMVIYHELHPLPLYLRSAEWDRYLKKPIVSSPLTTELIEKKLLVNEPLIDDQEYRLTVSGIHSKLSVPRILYLILAQGCNLSCKYCPIPRLPVDEQTSLLSSEDACSGLDLWVEHLTNSPNTENYIIFYGGEPLLNKETFYYSLRRIQQLKNQKLLPTTTKLMLATNGTLIDDQVIEACRVFDVMVALGLDGEECVNDHLRIYPDGKGTFKKVFDAIQTLCKNGINVAVSASLTPYSIDEIQKFSDLLRAIGVTKFGLNFLKGKSIAEIVPSNSLGTFIEDSVRSVIKYYKANRNCSCEFQIEKKKDAFYSGQFFPIDCTCYGNQVVIRADGQVSNCPFYNAHLGHVGHLPKSFRIWDTKIVHAWRRRLPLLDPKYAHDDAKALIGTGCAWNAIEESGDIMSPDNSALYFSRSMFDELIWSQFKGD